MGGVDMLSTLAVEPACWRGDTRLREPGFYALWECERYAVEYRESCFFLLATLANLIPLCYRAGNYVLDDTVIVSQS